MKHRLSRQAERDILRILADTRDMFGPRQVDVYAGIIDRAVLMLADDPFRPSSTNRGDIRTGVRSMHLDLAADRRGAAAHKIFFTTRKLRGNENELVILRVLHESMEPRQRIGDHLKPR